MSQVRCFALRRLAPFAGMTQVVQSERARAFSRDGEVWQIQVVQVSGARGRGETPAVAPPYLNTAIWTRTHGLRALPLDPMFELSTVSRLRDDSEDLAGHIAGQIEQLPFIPADTLELWLLHGPSGAPLALLDSRLPGPQPDLPRRPQWPGGADAEAVAELVRVSAGAAPASAWIQRDAEGAGRVLTASVPTATAIPAAAMPALLLREDWAEAREQALVETYLRQQAPLLLMLHGLPRAIRARVEAWAGERASELARWHHLYPEIADARAVKRALVEVELRRAMDD